MNDQDKKAALQKIREARAAKRNAEFAKGQAQLNSSQSNVFDHTLRDSDKMEVKSGDHWAAQLDAKRKAAKLSRGLPVEEAVGDTLDYKAMKKEMMNKGKGRVGDSLRRGIKPLSKGLKMLPIVGSLAGLMGAEDASAAVPMLDSADSAGMSPEDENTMMAEIQARKDYGNSPAAADRMAALEKLKKNQ